MNISNTSIKEAIKTALFYKDKQGRLRKKTNDYSGLQAYFANEINVDGGVVRTKHNKNLVYSNSHKKNFLIN